MHEVIKHSPLIASSTINAPKFISIGTLAFLWKFAILLVMAGVCYAVGFVKFRKKDLPL